MKTSRCFAPAPTARFRDLAPNLAWCRSCHSGPNSATSPTITSADKPVILRSLAIADPTSHRQPCTRSQSVLQKASVRSLLLHVSAVLACASSLNFVSELAVLRDYGTRS